MGSILQVLRRSIFPTAHNGPSACALTPTAHNGPSAFALTAALSILVPALTIWSQTKPTYTHDIAPILRVNCASCHRPGESGPFPLLTYEDAKKHSRQIAAVTKSRFMPPWLPEPGYGDFEDAHRLTDTEIRTIADWANAGAPEGEPAPAASTAPGAGDWQLGKPDLILKAPQPFSLPADGPDVFWNFVFSPPLTAPRYVRAIEIRAGGKRLVHHANLLVDRVNSARKLEPRPGAGFPGMDLNIQYSVFDPPGHFLFWKPGSPPFQEPAGFAWRLQPGNDLVLNAHLQPSGKPEIIQPSIGLYFTDKPPTEFPLLVQLEHDGAIDIPAGARDFVVSDDFRLPMDADILAVYPHAHYLGRLLEAYATLPGGKREWLIRIPAWDPNWQAVYRYRKPVSLPAGTLISLRYHYDNSAANPRNPNMPPKRVRAGNNATDEMGHLWLQVLPHGRGDRRRELEQAVLQHRIEKYPDDYAAHLDLGEIKMSRLDLQGAVSSFETAVRVDPKQSQGHNLLGAAFTRTGRGREAIQQFEEALRLDSGNVNARYNLVFALMKTGDLTDAEKNLAQVVAAYPKDASLHNLWGELLSQQEKYAQAIAQFDEALRLDASLEAARENRTQALSRQPTGK
ncbi:MAG TPA: tetratricopeptide repeat protein [Bryobacteraceae bacterium]|nr:tetratricopeptide repeat protein [Bryobacteraceae bacterium]